MIYYYYYYYLLFQLQMWPHLCWGRITPRALPAILLLMQPSITLAYCKDFKSTIACLKHCYHRRILPWDKCGMEQQGGANSRPREARFGSYILGNESTQNSHNGKEATGCTHGHTNIIHSYGTDGIWDHQNPSTLVESPVMGTWDKIR